MTQTFFNESGYQPKKKLGGMVVNDLTIASLKKYLDTFPDDAKIVLHEWETNSDFRVQIACNFEHQEENNIVILTKGNRITERDYDKQ